jgi:hypothetical protein
MNLIQSLLFHSTINGLKTSLKAKQIIRKFETKMFKRVKNEIQSRAKR